MRGVQRAEGRRDVRHGLDAGAETLRAEPIPRVLALPDRDDAEPLVGGARCVDHEAIRGRSLECSLEALVLLPARGDVVDERIRHAARVREGGIALV